MSNRRLLLGLGCVALLAAGLVTWLRWPTAADPRVAELQDLADRVFAAPPTKAEDMHERRQMFTELREKVEELSPEQRREMMKKPPPFAKMIQRDVETFFGLPTQERNKFLDKKIDEMEAMRKGMQQMFGGAGPPRPMGGAGMNPERAKEMRDMILNNTTAQQRGQMNEFMRAMQERRSQRGMEQMPGPPF